MKKKKRVDKITEITSSDFPEPESVKETIPDTENDNTPFQINAQVLMPELEELVKKNPNRLIGCGG